MNEHPILFFDGGCNLCNRAVDWLLQKDRWHTLRFAPLSGKTANTLLPKYPVSRIDSVVLWENGQIYRRSTAILRSLKWTTWPWRLLAILIWIPRPIRDLIYDWVARNRYRWFGRRDRCRAPLESERALFLE